MGQKIQDTKKFEMRLLLDAAKAKIIKSIETLMVEKNLHGLVIFENYYSEAYSEDGETAYMRQPLWVNMEGYIEYVLVDTQTEEIKNWNDEDVCPYMLLWILGEIEQGNYD